MTFTATLVPPTGFEPAFDIISIPLYDSRFEDGANTEAFIPFSKILIVSVLHLSLNILVRNNVLQRHQL